MHSKRLIVVGGKVELAWLFRPERHVSLCGRAVDALPGTPYTDILVGGTGVPGILMLTTLSVDLVVK